VSKKKKTGGGRPEKENNRALSAGLRIGLHSFGIKKRDKQKERGPHGRGVTELSTYTIAALGSGVLVLWGIFWEEKKRTILIFGKNRGREREKVGVDGGLYNDLKPR